MPSILVIDDDTAFCLMLKTFLEKNGFSVDTAFQYNTAIQLLSANNYDTILSDIRLPDKNGLELLKDINKYNHQPRIIFMTGYGDIRSAVNAIKMGAYEYVTKPVNPDEVLLLINQAVESKASSNSSLPFVEGISQVSINMMQHIKLVAPTEMSVLILGESGTGKEFVARKIHAESSRANKPFVAVDCGALPKDLAASEFFGHIKGSFTSAVANKTGQFVEANKGTLFLDEIGNLSYEIQIQLLRAIQERKVKPVGGNKEIAVDVRLITATNEDLRLAVQKGTFREDLYHRLNEFAIEVPNLSSRGDDLTIFAQYFLKEANRELHRQVEDFDSQVIDTFKAYSWPGNFRELRNVVRRAVLLCDNNRIALNTLPRVMIENTKEQVNNAGEDSNNLKSLKDKLEKQKILAALEKTRYNKSKAAELLQIDRKTLYNKLKQFGIEE